MINLRDEMVKKHMTYRKLAKITGFSLSTVYKTVTGTKTLNIYHAITYAKIFDLDYRDFYIDLEQEIGYKRKWLMFLINMLILNWLR